MLVATKGGMLGVVHGRSIAAIIATGACLLGREAVAAETVIVVDGDVSSEGCLGQGTVDAPFGSLQCALENGALTPGARVQLRDAAVAYAGADTSGLVLPGGTVAEPIIIEAEPGHAPIFAGALVLAGLDRWIVRDLVFDGSAGHDGGDAITVQGGVGVVIERVTVVDWNARGIQLSGTEDAVVRGNRVHRAFGHAIWLQDANGTLVEGNDVADVQCETFAFDLCIDCGEGSCFACGDCLDVAPENCVELAPFEIGGQIGLRVLGSSTGTDIGHNWFHDFAGTGCGTDGTNAAALFITRADARAGRIHHNLIERITPDGGPDDVGHAVLMFQGASDWIVDHNIVVDPGACGLCEGNDLFHGGIDTAWEHNTVIGGLHGIDVRRGPDASFVHNLVTHSGDTPVRVQAEALDAAPELDHNLYFDGGMGSVVGTWADAMQLGLAGWRDACACDASSATGDPMLSSGFTPAGDGPAIDLGLVGAAPFHGTAPDVGALEAPRLLAATIRATAPSTVLVELENGVAPPLAPHSCAGLQIVVDDDPADAIGCTVIADAEVAVELAAPIIAGQVVRVRSDGNSVRDSAHVGNRIDATVAASDLLAVNEAPPGDPGGSSSGSGDTDEGTPASGTDDGCGCTAPGRAPSALALVLLAIGWRRRSAR